MMKKIIAGAAFAAVLVMGTSAANAVLINTWTVDVASDFGAATIISGGTIETIGGGLLSWSAGSSPAESSLVQHLNGGTGAPGTEVTALSVNVDTNGGGEAGLSYTHNNIVIGGTPTLDIVIEDSIILTPFDPAGPAGPPALFDFNIAFVETSNGGDCVVVDGGPPCSDIFVLTDPEGLSFGFELDGFIYTVSLVVEGLLALNDAICSEAGQASGCVGFTTFEGENSTINTLITITAVPVPAPAALGLLGFGLIGLGAARRRRS